MLVTDEQERLVGIVTDRDLWHSAFLPLLSGHLAWEERWLKSPRVRDVMTWSVVTIDPDADLVRAGLLMFRRRIGSLPVTERGTLVGIVTERDVFDAIPDGRRVPGPGRALPGLIQSRCLRGSAEPALFQSAVRSSPAWRRGVHPVPDHADEAAERIAQRRGDDDERERAPRRESPRPGTVV